MINTSIQIKNKRRSNKGGDDRLLNIWRNIEYKDLYNKLTTLKNNIETEITKHTYTWSQWNEQQNEQQNKKYKQYIFKTNADTTDLKNLPGLLSVKLNKELIKPKVESTTPNNLKETYVYMEDKASGKTGLISKEHISVIPAILYIYPKLWRKINEFIDKELQYVIQLKIFKLLSDLAQNTASCEILCIPGIDTFLQFHQGIVDKIETLLSTTINLEDFTNSYITIYKVAYGNISEVIKSKAQTTCYLSKKIKQITQKEFSDQITELHKKFDKINHSKLFKTQDTFDQITTFLKEKDNKNSPPIQTIILVQILAQTLELIKSIVKELKKTSLNKMIKTAEDTLNNVDTIMNELNECCGIATSEQPVGPCCNEPDIATCAIKNIKPIETSETLEFSELGKDEPSGFYGFPSETSNTRETSETLEFSELDKNEPSGFYGFPSETSETSKTWNKQWNALTPNQQKKLVNQDISEGTWDSIGGSRRRRRSKRSKRSSQSRRSSTKRRSRSKRSSKLRSRKRRSVQRGASRIKKCRRVGRISRRKQIKTHRKH